MSFDKAIDNMQKRIVALEAENKKLREALEEKEKEVLYEVSKINELRAREKALIEDLRYYAKPETYHGIQGYDEMETGSRAREALK